MHNRIVAIGLTGNPHSLPPLPAWMVVIIATFFLVLFIRKAFRSKPQPNIIGEILELAAISGGASALYTTPLVSSAVAQAKMFENALNSGVTYGLAAISVILTLLAAVLYTQTDSEWVTPLFAVFLLAMAATQSWVTVLLQWIVDWPISFIWRLFLTVTQYVFNLHVG